MCANKIIINYNRLRMENKLNFFFFNASKYFYFKNGQLFNAPKKSAKTGNYIAS